MCASLFLSLYMFFISKDLSFGVFFCGFFLGGICLFVCLLVCLVGCIWSFSVWGFLGGGGLQILLTSLSVIYLCTCSGKIIISICTYPIIEEHRTGKLVFAVEYEFRLFFDAHRHPVMLGKAARNCRVQQCRVGASSQCQVLLFPGVHTSVKHNTAEPARSWAHPCRRDFT